ncbi:MAG: HlyC/CorC family transporter [Propionibacterium sp.]|nr:HlyC/CorC family transporter [Propionibacterium sp.]
MNQSEWIELIIALVCAVIASILAAVEMACTVTTRGKAERLVEDKAPGAERIMLIAEDPAPTINSVMFARMAFEITSITMVAMVAFSYFNADWVRVLTTVGIMLAVSFILWGVAPRTLGRQHPARILRVFGGLASILTTVLSPIAKLMILVGNALTPGKGFADGPFTTEAELLDLVQAAEDNELIEARDSQMIHSVFELGDTLVKEVMVPRTDMVFIKADKTLRQLLSLALRSGFSRIPVVGEGMDDIVGVAYFKDASRRIYDFPDAERGETVADIMRPASFCPDSKPAGELLKEMQRTRSHLVLIVDEFGGTAGLVTIEDILEEIVGEIVDEYDTEVERVVELGPGHYRVSSRLPVDDMGELFGLKLDDEDVETVWGLMAKQLNLVPIPGSRTEYQGIEMVADRAVGRRHQIGSVIVRLLPDEETEPAEQQEEAGPEDA